MNTDLNLENIRKARKALGDLVVETPVFQWKTPVSDNLFGAGTEVFIKLELQQKTGKSVV